MSVPTADAAPTVVAVAPAADTYTSSSAPTTDFGTSGSLAVYGSPENTAVLRFQFPAAPAGQVLTGASLRLRTTSLSSAGSANTLNVRAATDSWSETGTFYANRPAVSGPTLGSLPGGTVPNTTYDITLDPSQISGWTGSRTLAVTGTGTDSSWFWSRQASASLRPVLNLTYTDSAPADITAPSAPGALSAAVTGTAVALSWTASTDNVGVIGYTIHRSPSAGFAPSSSTRIADANGTGYSDPNRPAGTWYYRVTALDAAGNTSTSSNEASATIQPPPDTTAPGAPGSLAAAVTGTAVALSWTAATDNVGVTGYTVHRSTTAGFTPSTTSRIADATGLSYNDTNRPAGTWYYRVTATDAAGNTGTGSNETTATIQPAAPPTVLAVESAADTYTSSSAPTTDFGTSGSLAVYGSPDATTVLRFQFPAAPAGQTLTRAILRMRTTSLASAGSANTLNLRSAADSWSETGTFYANRPAVSGPNLGSLPGGTVANTAYDITLDTSLMTGWTGSRTLALTGTGTDSSWFWSRQASATLRPVLTLTYTDATPPDTTAPGAPGSLAATVTGTAVALSWTAATDNVGVTGYTVHRSTTAGFTPSTTSRIADATGLSYNDTNRPAGTWHYRVTATDAAGNTGTGSNETTATIQPGAAGTATVLAVGDIACAPGSVVTTSACRHGDVAAVVAAQSPDRFIAVGDLQYQNATLADFMGAGGYNDTFGALKAITSPVLGNHEYLDNTRGYFDYFYGPGVTTGDFGPRTDGYYSTTIGAWTFIALNSECGPGGVTGGCGVGSPEYLWLQDRLTNSPTACTLVAAHHPRWSTGVNHGSYPELGPMWDLMASHGVDVMISGHNHVSEIFKPIGASGSGTVPALSPTGIRSFTAGAGGADLQALSANTDPLLTAMVARSRSAFGPLKLTLNETSYSWQFLPLPGMTFTNMGTTGSFSGSDTCH
ncbi:DNRLRE domain-containing protein [Arthrobacter sp. ES3-54]|uniref:CBM96 family carbohydrate-binding protein n=1 Tax=Arthrobacter sp. ES3-54 TaxID=1502991 RepID=UPI002406E32E|nr:DNRLRE domain-containing protein [Arthrobacter sp. ES3-54]